MDRTSSPSSTRALEADISAASAHLKESWEQGKEAALEAKRIARNTLRELSRDIDEHIESRPKTVALEALGAGLVVGFLCGLLVSRAARAS